MKGYTGVIIAICLLGGLFIGTQITGNRNTIIINAGDDNKLNEVIDIIRTNYVDSTDIDSIIESSLPKIISELDPHSVYIPVKDVEETNSDLQSSFSGIGIRFTIQDDTIHISDVIRGGPSEKVGILAGDKIIEVNDTLFVGKDICTNETSLKKLKGPKGSYVKVGIERYGEKELLHFNIRRDEIPIESIEATYMINDKWGYVQIERFAENTFAEFVLALAMFVQNNAQGIIIDLRGNGGGLMSEAINIVSLFVPKGSLVVSSKGNTENSLQEYHTTLEPIDTDMPIIVMIDSGSASSSEIVSGALQDLDRATIMGKRSYGKGLVQSIRPLPYNGQLKVTTAKYYTPSGRCVQAIDYSSRNEDGSVGHIPDSLTKEFRTAGGRIVRDGGGITPDVDIAVPDYSRLVYALVLGGVIDQYVIDYARRHESIPAVDDFHFSDEDFEDFIRFAKTQDFDYRSSAKTYYDQMKKELEKDGLADAMSEELSALEKALEMDKERFIRLKKEEIIPFIEEELATRYWFQEAGVKVRLRYDEQLKTALTKSMI